MNAVEFGRQIELRPLRRLETLLRWMDAAAVSQEMRSLLEESIEDLRDVTLSLLSAEVDEDDPGPVSWSGVGEETGLPDEEGRWAAPLEAMAAGSLPSGFERLHSPDPGAQLPQLVEEESLMGSPPMTTPSEAEEPSPIAAIAQALLDGEDERGEVAGDETAGGPYATRRGGGWPVGDDELIYAGDEDDDGSIVACEMSLPAPVCYMLEDIEARLMEEQDEDFDLVRMVEDEVLRLWDG